MSLFNQLPSTIIYAFPPRISLTLYIKLGYNVIKIAGGIWIPFVQFKRELL